MQSILTTRRLIGAFAVVTLVAAGLLLLAGSRNQSSASAGTLFKVLSGPQTGPSATAVPDVASLAQNYPGLNLSGARVVISDSQGTVWLTTNSSGDVCLIEKPTDPGNGIVPVLSRFSCRPVSDVATQGIVSGVPGHWFGVTPDGFAAPTAAADGKSVSVANYANNAFRLSKAADEVKIGATDQKLPELAG